MSVPKKLLFVIAGVSIFVILAIGIPYIKETDTSAHSVSTSNQGLQVPERHEYSIASVSLPIDNKQEFKIDYLPEELTLTTFEFPGSKDISGLPLDVFAVVESSTSEKALIFRDELGNDYLAFPELLNADQILEANLSKHSNGNSSLLNLGPKKPGRYLVVASVKDNIIPRFNKSMSPVAFAGFSNSKAQSPVVAVILVISSKEDSDITSSQTRVKRGSDITYRRYPSLANIEQISLNDRKAQKLLKLLASNQNNISSRLKLAGKAFLRWQKKPESLSLKKRYKNEIKPLKTKVSNILNLITENKRLCAKLLGTTYRKNALTLKKIIFSLLPSNHKNATQLSLNKNKVDTSIPNKLTKAGNLLTTMVAAVKTALTNLTPAISPIATNTVPPTTFTSPTTSTSNSPTNSANPTATIEFVTSSSSSGSVTAITSTSSSTSASSTTSSSSSGTTVTSDSSSSSSSTSGGDISSSSSGGSTSDSASSSSTSTTTSATSSSSSSSSGSPKCKENEEECEGACCQANEECVVNKDPDDPRNKICRCKLSYSLPGDNCCPVSTKACFHADPSDINNVKYSCIPENETCCRSAPAGYCGSGEKCCSGINCISVDLECCHFVEGHVCPVGEKCCDNRTCIPSDADCCPDAYQVENRSEIHYCLPGNKCCNKNNCIPNSGECCQASSPESFTYNKCNEGKHCCEKLGCIADNLDCCDGTQDGYCGNDKRCCENNKCIAKDKTCCKSAPDGGCGDGLYCCDPNGCISDTNICCPSSINGFCFPTYNGISQKCCANIGCVEADSNCCSDGNRGWLCPNAGECCPAAIKSGRCCPSGQCNSAEVCCSKEQLCFGVPNECCPIGTFCSEEKKNINGVETEVPVCKTLA